MAKKRITPVKLPTPAGRLIFRSLSEPTSNPKYADGKPTYNATVTYVDNAETQDLIKKIEDFGRACFPKEWDSIQKKPFKHGKTIIQDRLDEGKEVSESFKASMQNIWQVKYSSNIKWPPRVVKGLGANKKEYGRQTKEDKELMDSTFYRGCIVRVASQTFAYDFGKGSRGVTLPLAAIMFVSDGEPLGGLNTDEMLACDYDTSVIDAFGPSEVGEISTGLENVDDINI